MGKLVKSNIEKSLSLFSVIIIFLIFLPLLCVLIISISENQYFLVNRFTLRWYQNVFTSSTWVYAGINSSLVALLVSLLSLLVGFLTAEGLLKLSLRFKNFLMQLFLTPIITPVILYAVAIFLLFSYLHFVDNLWALVFSQLVIITPISISLCYISILKLIEINPNIVQAAKTLGADNYLITFQVLLPNLKINLLIIFIICFLFSLNESVISQFISDTDTVTLSKMIFNGVKFELNPEIAVVSSFLMFLSISVFLLIRKLFGKISWK